MTENRLCRPRARIRALVDRPGSARRHREGPLVAPVFLRFLPHCDLASPASLAGIGKRERETLTGCASVDVVS